MNYPLTLEQYIAQMPMQEAELARMGAQVADALSAIHQQARVHGDVKPGNVLVVAPGSYQLIGYESERKYPEGTIPTFIAPELTQGGTYQAGTDIYALGMMMKSLIPKQGISGVFDEILRKACEPDPARRYKTALEFADELQTLADALQSSTVSAVPQMYVQSTEQPTMQTPEQSVVQQAVMQTPERSAMQRVNVQKTPEQRPQRQPSVQRTAEPSNHRQSAKKVTKETQKASLALRFLLPILLVLIIGASVLVYVELIHPAGREEATTTTAPTTQIVTETTTEVPTTEVSTEATTEEAECPYEYSQKVTVTAHAGSTSGMLCVYNWEHGDWVKKFAVPCVLGRNGIGSDYGEGKGVTPMGTFKLGFVMANVNPRNNMSFKMADSAMAIVDDPESTLYNTLVDTGEAGDEISVDHVGENIVNGKLNAIIYIEHNGDGLTSDGVTPGKGSVITICGNYNEVSETAGCIDISAEKMTELLKLLDGSMNPYIEITLN